MNPYASFLGGQNPTDVIAKTAADLKATVARLSAEQVNRAPAPGKWSIREILCHLADCEMVFAYRIRQTLAEPHHVVQPFDQDIWAKPYAVYSAAAALATFSAVRDWNLALVRSLPAEAFDKPMTHPERGTMTLRTVIETMGGHDINHLKQIEGIATLAASA
ncbi:MAG TPA: DinB family protein [Bryobacteraceae bacterium]|jgi:uncharacterized damage-inducible protein DinB